MTDLFASRSCADHLDAVMCWTPAGAGRLERASFLLDLVLESRIWTMTEAPLPEAPAPATTLVAGEGEAANIAGQEYHD